MRKSTLSTTALEEQSSPTWLDVDHLAHVEVTSEDPLFPIENALVPGRSDGWRAATTGPQIIRLLFDQPLSLRRIDLHIIERSAERSQELAIYAGPRIDALRETLRQQFTFSPGGSTEETETYSVTLDAISVLELRLDPDRAHDGSSSTHHASLAALRLA